MFLLRRYKKKQLVLFLPFVVPLFASSNLDLSNLHFSLKLLSIPEMQVCSNTQRVIFTATAWKEVRSETDDSRWEEGLQRRILQTRKFIEIKDFLPSLTMSYGMLKCPVDSSSTEPASLTSPPFRNDSKYKIMSCYYIYNT